MGSVSLLPFPFSVFVPAIVTVWAGTPGEDTLGDVPAALTVVGIGPAFPIFPVVTVGGVGGILPGAISGTSLLR